MTLRFILGAGLVALLLLLGGAGISYWLYGRKSRVRRRRLLRRRGEALRIDQFMLEPKETEPSER